MLIMKSSKKLIGKMLLNEQKKRKKTEYDSKQDFQK